MKDGKIHVCMDGGQHAPCGAKIASGDFTEEIQSSTTSDNLEKVTCSGCRLLVARLVADYNRAKRKKLINWSTDRKDYGL